MKHASQATAQATPQATPQPVAHPAATALQPAARLDFERPLTTVDVVIFTVVDERLSVLLVQRPQAETEPFPGRWALPGGFIDVAQDRTLQACARRKLRDKTGVSSPYLEQLGSWGGAERDPRGWSATHAWFALIPFVSVRPAPAAADGSLVPSRWVEVDAALRMRLAFDHKEILAAAVARLRSKVEYTSLPAFLLPEPITLPALQRIYEIVLGRELDKSAFRKRMLDAGFLQEAEAVAPAGSGRPAQGYRIVDRSTAAVFPRMFKTGE